MSLMLTSKSTITLYNVFPKYTRNNNLKIKVDTLLLSFTFAIFFNKNKIYKDKILLILIYFFAIMLIDGSMAKW